MVDKIKGAASFLKSKLGKDEITQLMCSAINDEESQPSTNIMHQIANASYSFQDWPKVWQFIIQKINSGKGIRVNKSLTIVEFILKNGDERIIRDLKGQTRMFSDLQRFSEKGQSQLRTTSIHRKASAILLLLNNPNKLQQQRKQAENLKLKLGGNNIYTNKSPSLSNSKSNTIFKTNYDSTGSAYQNICQTKQQSNLSKVSGIASNFVKKISNKFNTKQDGLLDSNINQYKNYQTINNQMTLNQAKQQQQFVIEKKPASKLFDKCNVKKPMGITKSHSNIEKKVTTPQTVKSEIKTKTNDLNPEVDLFEIGFQKQQTCTLPSSQPDLFDFTPLSNNLNTVVNNSFMDIDFFGFNSSPAIATQHSESKLSNSLNFDIFSSNSCSQPLIKIDGNTSKPNNDVFQNLFI